MMAADDVGLYFGFYVFLSLWELQHCITMSSVLPVQDLFKAVMSYSKPYNRNSQSGSTSAVVMGVCGNIV